MEYIFGTFIVFICLLYVETSSCGPNGNCSCTANNEMDCSETMLPLRDICEDIGLINVKNVSSLLVNFNDIRNISTQDLYGCERLVKLYLKGNKVSKIGKRAFQGFHKLEVLDLSRNNLAHYYQVPGQILLFPRSLKTLMLNANANADVCGNSSYPAFDSLSSLSFLYLDGLPNTSFPDIYLTLRSLRNLTLSGLNGYCNISVVLNDTFVNLPHLKELNISKCGITNIYAGAFQKLSNLERLDLSLNTQLGFRVARNITFGLQFTNIRFFNYSKVHSTFGIGTQIMKRDVCYLWNTSLTELALSSNRLTLLEENALMLLPKSLKIVHIEDNTFTFSRSLLQTGCASNVTEFYGNRQNTAHRPEEFFREPDDTIPKADPTFDECPYMKDEFLRNISLNNKDCPFLARNEKVLTKFIVPLIPKSLRKVHFSNCGLQYNVTSMLILPFTNIVEYADFSDNVLHAWTGPVGILPNLKHLDLSRNYCSYIGSKMFKYSRTIENLQIQENFIGLILAQNDSRNRIFDDLINVKTLNLSSNIISYIPPSTFSKMTKLETVDLSMNNINEWTIDVSYLRELKHLNLQFNSFHNLPESLRTRLEENVKKQNDSFKIDLRNNTITCTCEAKDFLTWMVKYKRNMVGFNENIFHDATGTRISVAEFVEQVKNLDKTCRSYVLLIVLSSIGLSAFISIVVGGIVYKNRWKLRYLVRMSRVRHLGYRTLHDGPVEETNYLYDAFISYADEDKMFVLDKLVPLLERHNSKVCHHERDFPFGRNVHDNIVWAVSNSRKVVAIVTEDFVRSLWCMYEFHMARMDSIYSRQGLNCLVVVKLRDVPVKSMSNEMLAWIRNYTYLEYTEDEHNEQFFWQSLRDVIQG